MSELQIVDGSASTQTYAVIARTPSMELAIRPFLTIKAGVNRGGKPADKPAHVLHCRVHLQRHGRDEMPTARAMKGWGVNLVSKSEARYYRNDVYIQVAFVNECTREYLTEKLEAAIALLLDALVENLQIKATLSDKEELVQWVLGQVSHKLLQVPPAADSKRLKNVPGLVADVKFKFDNQSE